MTVWESEARRIILGYAECSTTAEKITYVENLGQSSTDLAVLEEVLRFAVIGAVRTGTKGKRHGGD